jgi:PleD family two-component response regulator
LTHVSKETDRKPEAKEATMLNPFPPLGARRQGHVLVVDDDAINRVLLHDVLQSAGFVVEQASDGEAGLASVASNEPDVILLDVMMPKLDGFEVCRRLKQSVATVHIPVIIITALSDRAARLAGIEAGANEFVTKPIDQEEVCLRVRNAVYGKQLFDELQRNYRLLRDMEELRDNLREMIRHDNAALEGILDYARRIGALSNPSGEKEG